MEDAVILTGDDLKRARFALGLTIGQMARWLRLAGDRQGAKRVREMEDGRRALTGPVAVAVESFLAGYVPELLDEEEEAREG